MRNSIAPSNGEGLESRLRNELPELADTLAARPQGSVLSAEPTTELATFDSGSVGAVDGDPVIEIGARRPRTIGPLLAAAVLLIVAGAGVLLAQQRADQEGTFASDGAIGRAATTQPNDDTTPATSPASTDRAGADPTSTDRVEAGSTSSDSLPGSDDHLGEEATGCVGNRVWIDTDANGVQDPGEQGLTDALVALRDSSGQVVDRHLLFNGYFQLCGSAGAYTIALEIPDGYQVAAKAQGASRHYDSDAEPDGTIAVVVEPPRKRTLFDIGVVPDDEVAPPPSASTTSTAPPTTATPTTAPPTIGPGITVPPSVSTTTTRAPVTIGSTVPNGPGRNTAQQELAWGFWVETRNAYPDNGNSPKVDAGVETIFDNYSFAHVKAYSLDRVGGDTTDRTYVVNVLKAAEQNNTVLDLQLGGSEEYGWNFATGRGNFNLDRWMDAVSRFAATDSISKLDRRKTIEGDLAASAAIQRAIDNGTIRYIFLIDEPNHKRWSPGWDGSHGSNAPGNSNHVTNAMLDDMAAHVKSLWGNDVQTIVRSAPTVLTAGSRGGIYRFQHMTHAYLTVSSTKWIAGGNKGPGKGFEWFLTGKNNHAEGTTNLDVYRATNLKMSLMVQTGFESVGDPRTGQRGFGSKWWQGDIRYPYDGQRSYAKAAPAEMDYWIKSLLAPRDPETGELTNRGERLIDDFVFFRADRRPTDAGTLPFSTYPHYRQFLRDLQEDLDVGNLDPVIGIPPG